MKDCVPFRSKLKPTNFLCLPYLFGIKDQAHKLVLKAAIMNFQHLWSKLTTDIVGGQESRVQCEGEHCPDLEQWSWHQPQPMKAGASRQEVQVDRGSQPGPSRGILVS